MRRCKIPPTLLISMTLLWGFSPLPYVGAILHSTGSGATHDTEKHEHDRGQWSLPYNQYVDSYHFIEGLGDKMTYCCTIAIKIWIHRVKQKHVRHAQCVLYRLHQSPCYE